MVERSKYEAELRLSMGAARVAMFAEKTPAEAVEAVRAQLAMRELLGQPRPIADNHDAIDAGLRHSSTAS
ncbi:hypothetical protein GCM10023069_29530 [Shinella granuli]